MAKLVPTRIGISFAALMIFGQGFALAEPTLDNVLATVNVTGSSTCAHIDLKLNRPINITDSEPAEKALDITLHVEPLATTLTATGKPLKEAASVPPQNEAGLGGLTYDPASTAGPVVHFVFAKVMAYKLKRDEDNRHIAIDVAPPEDAQACLGFKLGETLALKKGDKADLPEPFAKQADNAATAAAVPAPTPGADAASALAEGKKLLSAGDFNRATAFFTKAVSMGDGKVKQEAQEMLGLSHERAMQLPFAKAEYETYLKEYPGGADAARVKDRLSGVMAAMEDQANKQFALHQVKTATGTAAGLVSQGAGKTDLGVNGPLANGMQVTNLGMKSNLAAPVKDPKAWTWLKNGSFAQNYYRDDNYVPDFVGGPVFGAHHVYQNDILSSADYFIRGENDAYALEGRIDVFDQRSLSTDPLNGNSSLSTVYVDGKLKGPRIQARLGRQSRSTGGVFGRFDGGTVSWEAVKDWKLATVVGSPVYGSKALPFADNRYFYGASLEYTSPKKDFGGSVYAIQQNLGDIVDRRAVGGEARYSGEKGTVYSAADYDLYFAALNNAYVTGTWLPRQGTTVYATADYRRLPFLLTSNALIGQSEALLLNACLKQATLDCTPFNRPDISQINLQTLVDAVGGDSAFQWASDRTASSKSISAGVSQQFNEKWSGSIDATMAYYTGTPSSGGVEATPDPGLDFYAGVTMSGTGVFRTNDTVTASLRYANSSSADTYMADAFYRLPIGEKLRLGPRLRGSYRPSKTANQVQYIVQSSLNVNYKINKFWTFESEIGARYQNSVSAGIGSETVDVLAMAGYRYDIQ